MVDDDFPRVGDHVEFEINGVTKHGIVEVLEDFNRTARIRLWRSRWRVRKSQNALRLWVGRAWTRRPVGAG